MTTNCIVPARHKLNTLAAAIAAGAISASAAPAVSAQAFGQAERAAPVLEEILITAQRRAESAQDAALSINVLSGNALESTGVSRPDDLTLAIPGIQVSGGATPQIYVRGIGDFGATAVANPAVVTSIDGVVVGRPQAFSGNLFDIDRIELLKGPQGTLYGRNASGGVLNVLTRKPQLGETGGYIHATAGNYDLFGAEGAINVGDDTSAYRLSFQVNRRDGYLSDGSEDDDRESLRFQALFEPTDRLSATASLSYTKLGGVGTGLVKVPPVDGASEWSGNTSDELGNAYIDMAWANFFASGMQGIPGEALTNPADFELFQDVKGYAASVEINYQLDWALLTAIPAWRKTEARFAINPAFLYNVGGAYNAQGDKSDGEETDQYSLEVRLSDETESLKWVAGLYYFVEDQRADYTIQAGAPLNIRTITEFETDAYAVFGQATYSITPEIRVTGGLRYTADERGALNFERYGISPMMMGQAPNPAVDCAPWAGDMPGDLCVMFDQTPGYYDSLKTHRELTWKAGLELDVGLQSLLYVDVSESFKAGGYNQAVSYDNQNALMPFEPETVRAYSIGSKNRFLDNRLQLNAELFYYDYEQMQVSIPGFDGDGNIMLITHNAGGADIKGLSVDMVAVPWMDGTIRFNVEYVDSEYKDFVTLQPAMFVPPGRVGCPVSAPNGQGMVSVDCSGMQLIRSPEWTATAGIDHDFHLGNGGNLNLAANLSYADNAWIGADFHPDQRVPDYTILSSSLTYESPTGNYFISGWVRNITDEEAYTGGGGIQSPFVTGWVASSIIAPRTYGLRVGFDF